MDLAVRDSEEMSEQSSGGEISRLLEQLGYRNIFRDYIERNMVSQKINLSFTQLLSKIAGIFM